jgi:hypothetical protein
MTAIVRAVPLSATVFLMACGTHVPIDPGDPGQGGASGMTPGLDAGKTSAPEDDGGSADASLAPTSSLFLMIDDMEDRRSDGYPPPPPGGAGFFWRYGLGNWFQGSAGTDSSAYHGDAVAASIVPPRGASLKARRVQSGGLSNGLDLYAQLNHPTGAPVDLHLYSGVSFWARLSSASGRLIVGLGQNYGGPFLTAEATQSPFFAQNVAVSEQWEHFILLFDDFRQGVVSGNTSGLPLATNAISRIDFVVGLNGEAFDLWIDDLALLCRGVCQTSPDGYIGP